MTRKITSLLLIEDNLGDARLLREMLYEHRPRSTSLHHVRSMAEAEAHLAENVVDIILLDLGLSDAQGVDAVRRAHAAAPRVPLVVLTGLDDEELAGLALQEGAQDYLIKGQIESRGLLRALRYAIERNIMEEERRAIEQLKDEFVSTVSHELRTPLTSIRGALGLLSSGMLGTIGEKGQRMLQIAVTNTDRLVRLINDILDIERLDSGTIELIPTIADAHALMVQAVDGVQAMADAAGVEIALEPCDAQLRVDSDRILQTLTNLLGNAIKFSPAGTCVTLSGSSDGAVFTMRVADRGRGIPSDKVNLIFERFKQVDASDSRDKGGSGLGLAICSSIINAHGGRIWTEKNGEQGSVFLFTVPVELRIQRASRAGNSVSSGAPPTPAASGASAPPVANGG